jgi:hypothetical protein
VNVLGHDDVTGNHEAVSSSNALKSILEQKARFT